MRLPEESIPPPNHLPGQSRDSSLSRRRRVPAKRDPPDPNNRKPSTTRDNVSLNSKHPPPRTGPAKPCAWPSPQQGDVPGRTQTRPKPPPRQRVPKPSSSCAYRRKNRVFRGSSWCKLFAPEVVRVGLPSRPITSIGAGNNQPRPGQLPDGGRFPEQFKATCAPVRAQGPPDYGKTPFSDGFASRKIEKRLEADLDASFKTKNTRARKLFLRRTLTVSASSGKW